LESILFGTVKGAYTGALDKEGLFEKAINGTVFLDEINSMPISLQAKILRVIQEKEVQRIGGNTVKKIKCSIISATNKPPLEAIRCKELREDLFYRLSAGLIFIPPLRERGNDVNLLLQYFIKEFNKDIDTNITHASESLIGLFSDYSWPGNIRELANTVESAINMTNPMENTLSIYHIPSYMQKQFQNDISRNSDNKQLNLTNYNIYEVFDSLKNMVESYEKKLIEQALELFEGNVTRCSLKLKITRQGLEKKIKKYHIQVDKYRIINPRKF